MSKNFLSLGLLNRVNPDAPGPVPSSRVHYVYDDMTEKFEFACHGFGVCEYCGFESLAARYQNSLLGQVLTVIDASVHDPVQNKAIKDLLKEKFYASYDDLNSEARVILFNCTQHKPVSTVDS